jgi:aminopeptidase 2
MCRSRAGLEGSSVAVQSRELLPANVVPRHYHLTVDTDFDKLTYKGTVVIDLDVAETSNSISLHTLELEIHSAKLSSGGQAVRLAKSYPFPFAFNSSFSLVC